MATNFVFGTAQADTLYGLSERDPSLAFDEVFFGNGGADIIYAGGGNDWVWASAGDASNVTFFGQDGDDVLVSFEGNDVLYGDYPDPNIDRGDDALGGGNDVLISGAGNDFLYGGSGNDSLWGGDGNDFVHGGLGADVVVGEAGDDWLYGGYNNSSDRDVVIGGTGNDHLYLSGGPATEAWGGPGDDYIVGGNGVLVGGEGNDFFFAAGLAQVIGGEGADTVAVLYSAQAIIWDFEVGADAIWLQSHIAFAPSSTGRPSPSTDVTYSTSYGTFTLNTNTGQQVTLTGTAIIYEAGVTNAVFYPVDHGITAFLPGVQVTSLSDLHVQTFTDFSFI